MKPRYRQLALGSVSHTCLVAFLLILSSLSLSSCNGSSSAYDPQVAYNAALEDSSQPLTEVKVSRNLTAVVAENTKLIRENDMPNSRVLVATWASQSTCNLYTKPDSPCPAGSECDYGYDTWVTVVPELKDAVGASADPLRVAQILGLPPSAASRYVCVLEMYVNPQDLFRPSPDPEITDHEAEIDFPGDGFRKFDPDRLVFSDMPCDQTPGTDGQPRCPACDSRGNCGFTTYKNWFENRRAWIYRQMVPGGPYPWTGLGYTYDWGNPIPPHIGLSEFVLNGYKKDGTKISVLIKSVTPTAAYFQ